MLIRNTESGKLTILHLEDSFEDAELVSDFIKKSDIHCDIHLVTNRKDFIDAIKNRKFDLILADINIPDFNGFESLQIVKEMAKDIPFIFVTGSVGEEMAVTALKSGATDFILKWSPDRLVPAVKRALEEKKIISDRKLLFKALKTSEERYRTLMENLPVGVFRTSFSQPGRFIQANLSAVRMLGLKSIEQLFKYPVEELYCNPEDRKEFRTFIIEHKNVKNRLVRLKKITGEPFWSSMSASCHFDKDGNPDWIDGVVEDVTERIEIEEKLSSYLKFFETLVDTINNPVFYKDVEGRYLGCNRSFAELIIGLGRDKIINKTVFELNEAIPQDLAEKYEEQDRKLILNPGLQDYESRVKCSDGVFRHFHFSKSTYNGPDGKVAGLVGIMMDITERVENERELKRINEELDLLITSLSSIIIGVSVKDRITHWNPFAELVFGIKASDIIGKPFYGSGIKWNWGIIYEAIANSILEEKSIRLDDLKFEKREGKNGILGLTINPLKRGGEILDGFIILGKDLTEQKILESQLLQANKLEAIGQLAAGVAHEINTPMQYVGDNLQFLNKSFTSLVNLIDEYKKICVRTPDNRDFEKNIIHMENMIQKIKLPFLLEQIPRALEQSIEGVGRVSGIVQSMKAFSHPGTKEKIRVNINRAIENTVTVSHNEWKYDCDLQLNLDVTIPEAPCFETELNQVLLNLIVNATDAIREAKEKKKIDSGLITISTNLDDSFVVIKVADNGCGIPAAIQGRIFDPFFTTKDVGKGTGQGLAISHSIIVEKHKGFLYFESEIGQGTTFVIKLPVE